MMTNRIVTIAAFCVYLIFMLCIGMYFVGKNKTTTEYFLGGRKLGSWVTSMSAQASDMSGWLLMGLPGAAYLSGISAGWIGIGLAIGTYLNWLLVAKPLRQYTKVAGDAITLPEYFKNRFHDESGWISVVSAVFILVFFLFYTASGFVSCAKLFSSVFGIPYLVSLTVGAVVVISYTFAGGFFAVCWTDFFQGLMMFFCVVAVPLIAVFRMGGPAEFISSVEAFNPNFLSMFVDGATNTPYTALGIVSLVAWGLGYFGQPHILVRFMGISSPAAIKKSRRIATVWVVISLTAAVMIGVSGRMVLGDGLRRQRPAGDHLHHHGLQVLPALYRRHLPVCYPRSHHVHCGLPAARYRVCTDQGLLSQQDPSAGDREGADVGFPRLRYGRCGHRRSHRDQPEQHGSRSGLLRMGRLRLGLRSARSVLAVLEAHQQAGRLCGHPGRRHRRSGLGAAFRRHLRPV